MNQIETTVSSLKKILNKYVDDITEVPNIELIRILSEGNEEEKKSVRKPAKRNPDETEEEEKKREEKERRKREKDAELLNQTRPGIVTIKRILQDYPDPLFNLQFFNPYLKKPSTISYVSILRHFKQLSTREKYTFMGDAKNQINEYKTKILE